MLDFVKKSLKKWVYKSKTGRIFTDEEATRGRAHASLIKRMQSEKKMLMQELDLLALQQEVNLVREELDRARGDDDLEDDGNTPETKFFNLLMDKVLSGNPSGNVGTPLTTPTENKIHTDALQLINSSPPAQRMMAERMIREGKSNEVEKLILQNQPTLNPMVVQKAIQIIEENMQVV